MEAVFRPELGIAILVGVLVALLMLALLALIGGRVSAALEESFELSGRRQK